MQRKTQFGRLTQTVTVVLLVMFAFLATAQAVHIHAADVGQDGHCQLCLMAHHSVVPTLQTEPVPARSVIADVYVADSGRAVSRSVFTIRIRPPPASL